MSACKHSGCKPSISGMLVVSQAHSTAVSRSNRVRPSDTPFFLARTCDAPDAPDGQLCHHAGCALVSVRLVQQHAVPVHTVQHPGGAWVQQVDAIVMITTAFRSTQSCIFPMSSACNEGLGRSLSTACLMHTWVHAHVLVAAQVNARSQCQQLSCFGIHLHLPHSLMATPGVVSTTS